MRSNWRPRRFEIVIVAAMIVGLWCMLFFAFAQARNIRRGTYCEMNLKRVGLAMMQYFRDYDEKHPLTHNWSEVLHPYAKDDSIFHCPATLQYGYSLNAHLAGLSVIKISDPDVTPLVFESSILQEFQHDKGKTWLSEPRHPQGTAIVFYDGHVEWRQQPPIFRSFKSAKSHFPLSR